VRTKGRSSNCAREAVTFERERHYARDTNLPVRHNKTHVGMDWVIQAGISLAVKWVLATMSASPYCVGLCEHE